MSQKLEQITRMNEESQFEIAELKRLLTIQHPWYIDSVADQLSNIRLAPIGQMYQVETDKFSLAELEALPYDSSAAFAYATTYCSQTTNICGKHYESDCTHYIAHCLAAGGVGFKGGDPQARCPAGLVIRAEELAAAFYNSTKIYNNVTQLDSYEQGRRGDYGFLKRLIEKSHAFLLSGVPNATSAPVYAHTNNHCGDLMESVRIYFGAYYRIG